MKKMLLLSLFFSFFSLNNCLNNAFLQTTYFKETGDVSEYPQPPVASNVYIQGTIQVGQVLTGVYTYNDMNNDPEANSAYQWLICDTPNGTYTTISGATSKTYTPQNNDEGKYLKFQVIPKTYISPISGDAVQSSATGAISAKSGSAPQATSVGINGELFVGSTLTGTYAYNDSDGDEEGNSNFAWYTYSDAGFSDEQLVGTSLTYTLQSSDNNRYIKFVVTPVAQTGLPKIGSLVESAVSSQISTPSGSAPEASSVNITGTTTLTGNYSYYDADNDLEGISTYRWFSADTIDGTYSVITGATSQTYTLTAEDEGKYIKFEVTPVAQTGTPITGNAVMSGAFGPASGNFPKMELWNDGALTPSTVDYGGYNIYSGIGTITYTIKNVGSAAMTNVTVTITSGGSIFTNTNPSTTINSSSQADFDISFDPDVTGTIERTVTISCNELSDKVFTVSGTGTVYTTVITVHYDPGGGNIYVPGNWYTPAWSFGGDQNKAGWIGDGKCQYTTTEIYQDYECKAVLRFGDSDDHWQTGDNETGSAGQPLHIYPTFQ